ncbi:hypothetical protein JCM15093_3238 [Bacteroides graminisolvens DSM 19988 = JCM 15093]|uniref:Uncharacterized protein n=1 Tax=Bacteroides graminisolvens DSM 19988 = JCM 15093 TaxID=1121097 RepID=A0A069D4Y9_9BACE|nr:hypothetical protein JCM15093_3238 [Bacteroides graminisolvens DSM 19988 = JCM 15093]
MLEGQELDKFYIFSRKFKKFSTMNILDLKAKAEKIIDDIKNNGVYLKENT